MNEIQDENDKLDSWPWSKKYLKEIETDMSLCVLDSIQNTLNELNVPKGTFGDDQFFNFVAMYNNRGDIIGSLKMQLEAKTISEELAALNEQNNIMHNTLVELEFL